MSAGGKPIRKPDEISPAQPEETIPVSRILADLRKTNGWTLAEVSRRTGVSISALSKIENGQSQPAYSVLTRLASGLDIDFVDLLGGGSHARFTGAARAVTRAGTGTHFRTDMGFYEMLATDLAAKSLQPMLIEILPREPDSPSVRSAHRGEEFVYVVEGEVVFEMNPYTPLVLSVGDSVYFDGSMDHGFYALGPKPGRILSVCFTGSSETSPAARRIVPDASDS
jgi:transcriptional regulator with XRE-family HTH domain